MKKIPSLFARNYETDRLVRNEVVPGSEWVLEGKGNPTLKWDGTSVLIQDGTLYKRYDAKNGKVPPEGFVPAQDADLVTGHWPGWVPCNPISPADHYHFLAFMRAIHEDGTYELIGPKVQGNPHGLNHYELMRHGDTQLYGVPRDFDGIKAFLQENKMEGIVWHHPDGRMVKIKAKDFGIKWP
jgi:hypothetical protein